MAFVTLMWFPQNEISLAELLTLLLALTLWLLLTK